MSRIALTCVFLWTPSLVEAQGAEDLAAEMRGRVGSEQRYVFGSEVKLRVVLDEVLLLRCSSNAAEIQDVYIYPSRKHGLYICCAMEDGSMAGTRSSARISPTIRGAFRQFDHVAAIASWEAKGHSLDLAFQLTDEREAVKKGYRRLERLGSFAQSNLHWPSLVGDDDFPFTRLTANDRVSSFVRLWSEVKYNFANFDLVPEVDWDRILDEYLPRVSSDQSNAEFVSLLQACIARLKDGHTAVHGPNARCHANCNATLPVQLAAIAGKVIIVEVGQDEASAQSGLRAGDELTHVDGRAVRETLENEIYPYVFASTPQWRDLKAFPRLLRGPENSRARLRVRSPDGSEREVTLTRRTDASRALRQHRFRHFEVKERRSGILHVRIDTFGSPRVVEDFKEALDGKQPSRGLLIDVRRNGGGNSAHGDAIIGHLIAEPIPGARWKTRQHRPAFRAWGRETGWYESETRIEPRTATPYQGPIVVLIGPATFSAAEDFVVPLHAAGRATVVGQRSGGSTGQPLSFRLPGGISGRICTKRDTYPDGREFVGVGIVPDVEVVPTVEDIASGRDRVLERGLAALEEMLERG